MDGPRRSVAGWWPLSVVLLAAAAVVAFPRAGSAGAPPSSPEQTWQADCAVCHGATGRGTANGPALVGVGRASVDYELRTGRMPLFPPGRSTDPGRPRTPLPDAQSIDPDRTVRRHAPAYDDATIAALVDYVGGLAADGGPPIPVVGPGDEAAGGELYRENCAACHSWSGDGGALYAREAPALHAATPVQVAEAIRVGPGQMPAFGTAALSPTQVDDLVPYVQALDHPTDRGGFGLAHVGPVAEGAVALGSLVLLLGICSWIGERRHAH